MSFIKLEKRIGVNDTKLGASMSMRIYTASPKPVSFVSLRKHFLETAKFKVLHFDVAVGEGINAGKIRITPNVNGVFVARELKSALVIDLGHIHQLGAEEHKNRSAEVVFEDGAAVVTIPDWECEVADDDDEAEEEEESEVATPITPPRKPGQASTPAGRIAASSAKAVTHKGITINLTEGNESVSYRGHTVEVSSRGARLIEMLAKVMPACIGDALIISRCWDTKPTAGQATALLDMVCRDLLSLKKIGLEVRHQRGIGRQLIEVQA